MTSRHSNIETTNIGGTCTRGRGIARILHTRRVARGEPRHRPSPRHARRAQPGLPPTRPDAIDINEPNEVRA